ncbi:MAG: hypothetical protein WDO15_06435 [Bacteroidota bacterium]
MHSHYDVPASYIGLTLLSAYSTAIGTSYAVESNGDNIFLPVWACLCGISSSGGTTVINKIYSPLADIQDGFDLEWSDKTTGLSREKVQLERDEHGRISRQSYSNPCANCSS